MALPVVYMLVIAELNNTAGPCMMRLVCRYLLLPDTVNCVVLVKLMPIEGIKVISCMIVLLTRCNMHWMHIWAWHAACIVGNGTSVPHADADWQYALVYSRLPSGLYVADCCIGTAVITGANPGILQLGCIALS